MLFRSAERVPDVRVEVERRGVRDDLREGEGEGGKGRGGKEGCQRSGRWACVSGERRDAIGDENDGAWRDGEMERWEMGRLADGTGVRWIGWKDDVRHRGCGCKEGVSIDGR